MKQLKAVALGGEFEHRDMFELVTNFWPIRILIQI